MHPDLLDILKNVEVPINDEVLIAYLTGNLSDEENNAIERELASSNINAEALEGLQMVKQAHKIRTYQQDLHTGLHKILESENKPNRKPKAIVLNYNMIWVSLIIVLLLIAWGIIFYLKKG